MPPTESVEERILAEIAATLKTIVQGDTYWNTVRGVFRETITPGDLSHLDLMVISPSWTASMRDGGASANGIVRKTMLVDVVCWRMLATASATETTRICRDIEVALGVDRTRGGLATTTHPVGREAPADETTLPYAALTVRFEVYFKHEYGAPETVM